MIELEVEDGSRAGGGEVPGEVRGANAKEATGHKRPTCSGRWRRLGGMVNDARGVGVRGR